MDEEKVKKLGELITNHATAKLIFASVDANGQQTQRQVQGAQFTEDLDGNQIITLW